MFNQNKQFDWIANACTSKEYKSVGCKLPSPSESSSLSIVATEEEIAVACENLYRVASLLAYGNNLAGFSDIDYFTVLSQYDDPSWSHGLTEIKVLLPVSEPFARDFALELDCLPKEYEGYDVVGWTRDVTSDRKYQAFSLVAYSSTDDVGVRKLIRLLGVLIANSFARPSYIMYYDGMPVFDETNDIQSVWLTLAQLSFKESPAICPVCGKIVDRRRSGSKGGQPRKACSQKHIDDFNNEKKRLSKTDDTQMQFASKLEMKAREMRWRDDNNARLYQFLGVKDMEDFLKTIGSVSFSDM
jgi:hypothetical protein